MGDSITTVVPITLFFVLGMVLVRVRFATAVDGQFLLKMLFFVALPSLTLVKLTEADLSADKALLPVSCVIVNMAGLTIAWLYGKRRGLPDGRLGPLVLGTMVLNNAFLVPFVLAGYGDDALADLVLFDVGNALVVSVIAYPLAFRFGGQDADLGAGVRRALTSPFTWAIATGLVLNITGTALPAAAEGFLAPLGAMTGPLILIALGILFTPSIADVSFVTTAVGLRMVGGLAIGLAVVTAFGFTGDTRTVVLLGAASPIGFTTLTFSSMAGLDIVAAARAVSASLFVGIITVPLVVALTS